MLCAADHKHVWISFYAEELMVTSMVLKAVMHEHQK